MSDSEDEHPSSTSVCLRESESSISRGEQRAKTRKKMISTSSEGEEEEEEEEKELKEQQPQHQEEATSSCVGLDELPEEEGDSGAAAAIQDEAAYDNFALTEGNTPRHQVFISSSFPSPFPFPITTTTTTMPDGCLTLLFLSKFTCDYFS